MIESMDAFYTHVDQDGRRWRSFDFHIAPDEFELFPR